MSVVGRDKRNAKLLSSIGLLTGEGKIVQRTRGNKVTPVYQCIPKYELFNQNIILY